MKTYDSYKDSGIDWLGEIPEHWEVKRLKYLVEQINQKESTRDRFLQYFGMENIEPWTGKYIPSETELEGIANVFFRGCVLFGKLRPYLAKVHLAETDGLCSSEFLVLEPLFSNPKFLQLMLISNGFINVVNASTYGTKMPRANPEFILNQLVILPPLHEQEAIARFLDDKCAKIDELVAIKEQQIDKLKELRQVKIHQAVTKGINPNVEMKNSGIDWIGEIPKHWEVKKVKEVSSLYGRIGFRGYNQSDLVGEGEGCITISPSNIVDNHMVFAKNSYLSWEKYYESPEIMIFNDDILIVKTGSTVGKVGIVKNLNEKATINPQLLVLKNIKMNVDFYYEYLHSSVFF